MLQIFASLPASTRVCVGDEGGKWKILLALAENLTRLKSVSFAFELHSIGYNWKTGLPAGKSLLGSLLATLKPHLIPLYTHNPQKHVFSSIKEDLKGKQKHLKGLRGKMWVDEGTTR